MKSGSPQESMGEIHGRGLSAADTQAGIDE